VAEQALERGKRDALLDRGYGDRLRVWTSPQRITEIAAILLDQTSPRTPMRSSRWAITPGALAGFGVATLLVVAGGLAALYEQRATSQAGDWTQHTLDVMVQIGRVRDALVDAESGQRGYLLTRTDSYLEPYRRSVAELPGYLSRLREVTQDDPGQQTRLDAIEPLVTTKLDELQHTIDLRRERGETAALAVVVTDAGRHTMDQLRALLGQVEAEESQLLTERVAIRAMRSRDTASLITMTIGGGVLATLFSVLLVVRAGRAQLRAEARVRETEEQLRMALSRHLADAEARARAVLDTTASAIISIDAQGQVATFNQAAERMFGYAAAEVIGRNVKMLMPAPYREEHDDYLRRYVETGVRKIIGVGREVTGLRKDGTAFPVNLAVNDTVLHGEHLFTGVLRDLTQQKEADERERKLLEQALQNARLADIGAMTTRIAHDFGNPLAGLQMTAQRLRLLLLHEPVQVERVKAVADSILETTKRLDTIVWDFKEVAREPRLKLRDVVLPGFLKEVVTAWQQEADGRGIVINVEFGDRELPVIRVDPDKLRRLMDNLVKNALEAIEHGPGVVRIAAALQGRDTVRILVEDTGPGIAEGTNVFALFETTKPTGTGLGLAICKQIALVHGGDIKCSPRVPHGTIFCVELPVHGARPARMSSLRTPRA
jgi:two-component system sensor kinase FixL